MVVDRILPPWSETSPVARWGNYSLQLMPEVGRSSMQVSRVCSRRLIAYTDKESSLDAGLAVRRLDGADITGSGGGASQDHSGCGRRSRAGGLRTAPWVHEISQEDCLWLSR